jgi:hypothetical protein
MLTYHLEAENALMKSTIDSTVPHFREHGRFKGWNVGAMILALFLFMMAAKANAQLHVRNGVPSATNTRDELPPADKAFGQSPVKIASVQEMVDSLTDVWGDAAMRQPDGASYEFFKDLLPPLRWVNTDFRYYPIVLSAPRAPQKARLVSNGSAVNAKSKKPPMWHEQGVPVTFYVGHSPEVFGSDFARLEEPTYLEGYLPVVGMRYKSGEMVYEEEAFAPVDEESAAHGVALIRFSVRKGGGKVGRVEARINSDETLRVQNREVLDGKGQSLLAFGREWSWEAGRKALVSDIKNGSTAELAIFTKPKAPAMQSPGVVFEKQKALCTRFWKDCLSDNRFKFTTPERIVNDAWRAMLIGNLMIAIGDRPHYSAGNAYAKLYEAECGDTMRSLMLFGHLEVGPGMLKSMLEFNRKETRFHVAGQKLQLLSYFYWLTRDAETVRKYEPLWRQSVELILSSRERDSGLLPKDRYAGDIATQVYSLNSNANCWRGLRDLAAVLDEMGSKDEAKKLRKEAANYRTAILKAVDRSEHRETKPPFIPISLLAGEEAYDRLTATRFGSYYDLICPYIIGSEIFGQGSEREDWLLGYLQNHGGVAMGMVRVEPQEGQYKNEPGVNPLYGLRYQLALLRRDEREKALVGFYGQLAQGMTRGTFIGGEGSRFRHGDANGRSFYLPPNSTSNAAWLVTLRYLLIQDWDLDEDGKPDTIRLLFGIPRRWLAGGTSIEIENAPTAFGRMSIQVESKLSAGSVNVRVTPPPRGAKKMVLRAPLPTGWQVDAVELDGKTAALQAGDSVDLTGKTKPVNVRFSVKAVANGR